MTLERHPACLEGKVMARSSKSQWLWPNPSVKVTLLKQPVVGFFIAFCLHGLPAVSQLIPLPFGCCSCRLFAQIRVFHGRQRSGSCHPKLLITVWFDCGTKAIITRHFVDSFDKFYVRNARRHVHRV